LRRLAFDNLSPFGRQIILGNASGTDETFHGDEFWHGTKSLRGLSLGSFTHRIPQRVAHAAQQVLDLAAATQITATHERVMPLAETAEAHRLLEARAITGKIVLRI
jgi:NADPH2:quinone reductase